MLSPACRLLRETLSYHEILYHERSTLSSNSKTRERLDQKLRTRALLLQAARELVSEGKTPSIAAVADAAMVSRATAYRYFPNPEVLLAEVPLDMAVPTVGSLFDGDAPTDPEDR